MHDEFISREAALKALFAPGMCYAPMQLQIIKDLPAADVAPVVHGRWVSVAGKRDRICSRCMHNEPYKNADDDAEVFEFCPHCGAKMDGGDTDADN